MSADVCGFDGCGRTVESRGLCQAHAQQARRTGRLSPLRKSGPLPVCSTDECDGTVHGRGMCRRHYLAAKREGVLPPVKVRTPAPRPAGLPKPKLPEGLPDGWFRPSTPAKRKPQPEDSGRFVPGEFVVPPVSPETRAAALAVLSAHGGLDLVGMLGLDAEEVAA